MIRRYSLGALPEGGEVFKYRLQNASGAFAEIATLGGCLISVHVPDRAGRLGDILLGYDTVSAMLAGQGYMGFLIGRFGNRIGGAAFELGGRTYHLAKNDGENHLHGGVAGFDKKLWRAEACGDSLALTLRSPDGDEGYPGALDVTVVYAFSEDNTLRIAYEAVTDADTILNLTNHAYFNLSGPGCPTILDHLIQINADAFTEVSSRACIPTGRLLPVDGTPFDLRSLRSIREGLSRLDGDIQMQYGNGYDHNFALRDWDGSLRQAAAVVDKASGRRMDVFTDQPGIQFYGGNGISGETPGKLGAPYTARQGLCLETQHFPDSPHHPAFPSCVLKKGETYRTVTEYRFSLER